MITIRADFNAISLGRVDLSRLREHATTPFARLAAAGERIRFVDFDVAIDGWLECDGDGRWFAVLERSSEREITPASRQARLRAGGVRRIALVSVDLAS